MLRVLLVSVVLAGGTMGGTTSRDNFARGVGTPSVQAQYEILRLVLATVLLAEGTMGGTTSRDNFERGVDAPSVKSHY